jgi:hypothetical protein
MSHPKTFDEWCDQNPIDPAAMSEYAKAFEAELGECHSLMQPINSPQVRRAAATRLLWYLDELHGPDDRPTEHELDKTLLDASDYSLRRFIEEQKRRAQSKAKQSRDVLAAVMNEPSDGSLGERAKHAATEKGLDYWGVKSIRTLEERARRANKAAADRGEALPFRNNPK